MNLLGICKDYEPRSIVSIKITKLKEKQTKKMIEFIFGVMFIKYYI